MRAPRDRNGPHVQHWNFSWAPSAQVFAHAPIDFVGYPEGINHLAGERVDVHPEALERNRPKMDTKVCTSLIAGLQIWRFC